VHSTEFVLERLTSNVNVVRTLTHPHQPCVVMCRYVWDGNKCVQTIALHTGPVFALFNVRDRYVSGGKDGVVKLWAEGFEKCEKE
jgi:WD40 repeat protein